MTLLIILLILTVGSLIWFILDMVINDFDLFMIPFIILIFTVVIGWLLMGNIIPQKTKQIEITSPIEVTKSSKTVFVEVHNKTWEFNKHEDYVNINDSTEFYYIIDYNMYNSEISRELKYKSK